MQSKLDNSSRRAFSLDSRTVWVEQQLVHQCLLPRDNLPLGPGEYSPSLFSRHVSTPVLGKMRQPVDALRYNGGSRSSTSPARSGTPTSRPTTATTATSEAEFKTIYHFNEERQPLDPKLRHTETPGPTIKPDDALQFTSSMGISKVHQTVHMDTVPSPDGRFPIKPALVPYDVNYDSLQVRPTPKYGSFSKNKRIYIPLAENQEPLEQTAAAQPSISIEVDSPPRDRQFRSITEERCALVRLPKLKTRAPPVLVLHDSSYKRERLSKPLDLTPSLVNKQAYVHLFDRYLSIPRNHKSCGLNYVPSS